MRRAAGILLAAVLGVAAWCGPASAEDFTTTICAAGSIWRFESGAFLTDTCGSNDLTDHNSVTQRTASFGEGDQQAEFLASSSQYLSHSDTDALSGTNITFGCLFERTNSNSSICLGKWGSSGQYEYKLQFDAGDGKFHCYASYNGTNYVNAYGSYSVAQDRRVFAACVVDDDNDELRLYVWDLDYNNPEDNQTFAPQGLDENGSNNPADFSAGSIPNGTSDFTVGSDGSSYATGYIDGTFFYKGALTRNQLAEIARCGFTGC